MFKWDERGAEVMRERNAGGVTDAPVQNHRDLGKSCGVPMSRKYRKKRSSQL